MLACSSSAAISSGPFWIPTRPSIALTARTTCQPSATSARTGQNGELLGYGARSLDAQGAVQIRIFNDDADLFAFFASDPRVAEFHARERLLDIATYLDDDL